MLRTNGQVIENLPALKRLLIGLLIGFAIVTGSVLQAQAEQTVSTEGGYRERIAVS